MLLEDFLSLVKIRHKQAQLQLQLQLKLSLAVIPFDPAHPPGHPQEKFKYTLEKGQTNLTESHHLIQNPKAHFNRMFWWHFDDVLMIFWWNLDKFWWRFDFPNLSKLSTTLILMKLILMKPILMKLILIRLILMKLILMIDVLMKQFLDFWWN